MDDQQLKGLKDKLDSLEKMMETMKGKGMSYYINIEHADIHGPVVDKLDYNFDKLDVKEVSGALNLGNNFGVRVGEIKKKNSSGDQKKQATSQKKQQTASSHPQSQQSSTQGSQDETPEQTESQDQDTRSVSGSQPVRSGHGASSTQSDSGQSLSSGQEETQQTKSKGTSQPSTASQQRIAPDHMTVDETIDKRKSEEVRSDFKTGPELQSISSKRKKPMVVREEKTAINQRIQMRSETEKRKSSSSRTQGGPSHPSAEPMKISFQKRRPNQVQEEKSVKPPLKAEKPSYRTEDVSGMGKVSQKHTQDPPKKA